MSYFATNRKFSLFFFSWILVLLLSSQCRKASTPSTGKAAAIFEEAAKAFEKLGQVLRQWGDVVDATSGSTWKWEEREKEKEREKELYRSLAVGLEETAKAFAKAERAAREKTVEAAKSQALEEAKTFEKVSATFDAVAVALERHARVFKKSGAVESGYIDEEKEKEKSLLGMPLIRASVLASVVSAEGTVAKAFEEASVIFKSLCELIEKDDKGEVLKEAVESAEGVARMFKEAAKEAISRTE